MPKKIIIDCERMKNQHNGLYHYCYNLGMALQEAVSPLSEELTFFMPGKELNVFGNNQNYLLQHPWHQFLLPSLKKYSLWHSTHQDSNYFPAQKKIPIVLTVHDINIMHNKNKTDKKKKLFLFELEKKIKRAGHVVFISSFTMNDVKRYIDLDNKPATVIYNGCNIKEIKQLTSPAFVPKVPFFLTIGTVMEKKNFHVLPALLPGNDRLLIIAGVIQNENYKQLIIKEAIKHGVENRVIFTGPVSENDKQWYLKNCEAFCFPSLTEGFGLPVVEAMYFGVPIFLSSFTSLPEIGGEVCYYFTSFEKDAMQQVVEKGLQHYNNTEAKISIQERAALFSWKDAANKYLEVYRSLY